MLSCQNHPIFQTPQYQRRTTTNLPLSKASLKGPLSSSHLNIWSFLPKVCLQLKHRNSSMKTTLEGAKGLTNSLCGVSSKAFAFSRKKIDLEPKWPVFLEANPSKHGLFEQKQGSFGFQGYMYIYIYGYYITYKTTRSLPTVLPIRPLTIQALLCCNSVGHIGSLGSEIYGPSQKGSPLGELLGKLENSYSSWTTPSEKYQFEWDFPNTWWMTYKSTPKFLVE